MNILCFDKTGTLTESGLDIFGIVPIKCSAKDDDYNDFDNSSIPIFDDIIT